MLFLLKQSIQLKLQQDIITIDDNQSKPNGINEQNASFDPI